MKDAARAVKRRLGRAAQKVREVTVSQLLDLAGLRVTAYEVEACAEHTDLVHLYCAHEATVALCPRCRTLSTTFHDSKARCVRDLDIWGKRTFIHFAARRFDCEPCGRPFTERVAWLDRQRRHTRRYEQQIYQRCLTSPTQAVAQAEHLHVDTVKGIFKRWAKRTTRVGGLPRVRVLGIDEIALKKRHKQYVLVLSDLERRCVLAVLPDRKKATLEAWFDHLSADQRQAIRLVSIDLWEPYRQAVQTKLPHARLVADRFHVMQQLNERLTQLRRALQRRADEATRELLKGTRWLLVKNRAELSTEEETRLQRVLAACPQLRAAYLCKEEFRLIFERLQERAQAERFLRAWLWQAEQSGDRYLRKFAKTLRRWWEEILNYFVERTSNGFVEGMNHAIRVIIQRAYGFRNFDNFRLQVLAQHGYSLPLPHDSG